LRLDVADFCLRCGEAIAGADEKAILARQLNFIEIIKSAVDQQLRLSSAGAPYSAATAQARSS
jgi:hypothetical protein